MSRAVTEATNLFDFFNEALEGAQAQTGVRLTNDTSLYVADLLTQRARGTPTHAEVATLAELHGRAANAPPTEQARVYRELGDRALYALGFFSESLARKTVPPSYYADMGAAAYERVDEILARWFQRAFGPVFHELAERFRDCVHLLEAIRTACERERLDPLQLAIERFERGDEAALQRLLLPTPRVFES